MRYYITLPIAMAMLVATPAMAQDTGSAETAPPAAAEPAPPADAPVAPVDTTTQTDAATADTTDSPPAPAEVPAATDTAVLPATTDSAPPAEPATTTGTAPSTLTPDQKAAYDAWPANAKSYFDGLSPERQALFLRIADADKLKLVALDPAQQETVWQSIESQDAAQKTAPGN